MNKIILKRLVVDLAETLLRVELELDRLEPAIKPNQGAYFKAVRNQYMPIREDFFALKKVIVSLFLEDTLDEVVAEDLFINRLPLIREAIGPVITGLSRLQAKTLQPETGLFLNSLRLSRLLPDGPEIFSYVQPEPNLGLSLPEITDEHVVLAPLGLLSVDSPLAWGTLIRGFARYYVQQTLQLQNLLDEIHVEEPKSDLIAPLIGLRLIGPSYYVSFVLNALNQQCARGIQLIEPLLFQALNRFGLIHKDLVILHQSLDKVKALPAFALSEVDAALSLDSIGDALLKAVEKVIPERLAFTEKSLLRSQLLQERLEQGVLIAAVPILSNPVQLHEDLEALLADDSEEQSIYPLLHQIAESPASPRDIINAGALYKLEQSPDWLAELVQSNAIEVEWQQLRDRIQRLDTLLLKSIEVSEVHRILDRDEQDVLATV